jgi:hypothetical protein
MTYVDLGIALGVPLRQNQKSNFRNCVFDLISYLSSTWKCSEKEKADKFVRQSNLVERFRPKSNQLIKDMLRFKVCKKIKNMRNLLLILSRIFIA